MAAEPDDRATDIYVASAILREGNRSADAFGVAEIVDFLSSPGAELTMAQSRRLFVDPKLRETYRLLKARLSAMALPAVAAASTVTGAVTERRFEGGTLRLSPSRNGIHANLLIRFDRPTTRTLVLLLESPDQGLIKLLVQASDSAGETLVILDVARDAAVIAALRDPGTTGAFLYADT